MKTAESIAFRPFISSNLKDMLTTIIVFILVLGLLIFVHELGHFVMAKRAGVRVDEFGFGYPPRVFGIKKGETIYSLNLLPIGGFVKIHGENGPEEKDQDKKRAFYNQPIGKRAQILIAGVSMNLLLAALVLSLGFWLGLPQVIEDEEIGGLKDVKVQVSQVVFASPAEQAGIMTGDSIIKLKNPASKTEKDIMSSKEVQDFVEKNRGQEIIVTIQRGEEVLEKTLVPRSQYPQDEGPMGIALVKTALVSYPWYEAIWRVSLVLLSWLESL